MRSGKSFFNKTLYIHDLKRGWPIWLTYFLVYLFPLVAEVQNFAHGYNRSAADFANEDIFFFTAITPVVSIIFGVLAAMTLFNYLYSPRSANGLHALPLKREGHFLTHFAAGMSYFIIPNAVLAALSLLFELYLGSVNISVILLNFIYMTLILLFFFSFAVFCAQFAGHIVALPVFYIIWNFFFAVLTVIMRQVLTMMLFGFHNLYRLQEIAINLTPVVRLMEAVDLWSLTNHDAVFWIVVYAIAGCVFAVAALLLYRCRQLETAGDIIAIWQAKPVFRYGVALFFGSLMALFTMSIFGYANDIVFYVMMVLWGLLGYYVAEMLLHKSFRVFKKGFKGAVGYALAMLVLLVGIRLDFTGFERRVPNPAQVENIGVIGLYMQSNDTASNRHNSFQTAEEIEALTQIHQAILDQRNDGDKYNYYSDTQTITITYQLKDGSSMSRLYLIPMNTESIGNPNHAAHKLLRLINRSDYLRNKFFPPSVQMSDFIRGTFSIGHVGEKARDLVSVESENYTFTAEQTRQLYLAVSEDLSTGRIGQQGFRIWDEGSASRRMVISAQNNQVYTISSRMWDGPQLSLTYHGFYPEWEYCSWEYSYDAYTGESCKQIIDTYYAEFMLNEMSVSTIAALAEITDMTEAEILNIIHMSAEAYY